MWKKLTGLPCSAEEIVAFLWEDSGTVYLTVEVSTSGGTVEYTATKVAATVDCENLESDMSTLALDGDDDATCDWSSATCVVG